jgi:hypothetical protein
LYFSVSFIIFHSLHLLHVSCSFKSYDFFL